MVPPVSFQLFLLYLLLSAMQANCFSPVVKSGLQLDPSCSFSLPSEREGESTIWCETGSEKVSCYRGRSSSRIIDHKVIQTIEQRSIDLKCTTRPAYQPQSAFSSELSHPGGSGPSTSETTLWVMLDSDSLVDHLFTEATSMVSNDTPSRSTVSSPCPVLPIKSTEYLPTASPVVSTPAPITFNVTMPSVSQEDVSSVSASTTMPTLSDGLNNYGGNSLVITVSATLYYSFS